MIAKLRMVVLSLMVFLLGCEIHKSEGMSVIGDHVDFGEKDYEKIALEINRLGFSLMDKVERDEENNAFISPTSLYMLLSIIYNGADGETSEEMSKFLGVNSLSSEEVSKANASLIHSLYKQTNKLSLHIANSLWLKDSYTFREEFAERAKDYFNGEIKEVKMEDNKTVDEINRWVREATNKKIEEIVEGPLDPRLVTLLVNAVYFNGDWKYSFDERQTINGIFYGERDERNDATYMRLERKLPYFETANFQSVSLPYGDGEMSMNIFLPKEGKTLNSFISELTLSNWKKWEESYVEEEGTLLFPKFKLEYETILNEALIDLGLKEPFNPSLADLSQMIQEDEDIYIDLIKQKTYIDVHEKGTEAAAVTSAQIRLTSAPADPPFYMDVNRPFFFTINDEETGVILFMGAIHVAKQ